MAWLQHGAAEMDRQQARLETADLPAMGEPSTLWVGKLRPRACV